MYTLALFTKENGKPVVSYFAFPALSWAVEAARKSMEIGDRAIVHDDDAPGWTFTVERERRGQLLVELHTEDFGPGVKPETVTKYLFIPN